MDYPSAGDNKLYSKGLTITLDSLAEIDIEDVSQLKDNTKYNMLESGQLEDEETPKGKLNQPRILLHNKNEIPSLLSTRRTPLTLSSDSKISVTEVKIPLKVNISLNSVVF